MTTESESKLNKLNPLRPETTLGVVGAGLVLSVSELVRNGIWVAYITQVIDTRFGLPAEAAATAWMVHLISDTAMRGPMGALISRYGLRPVMLAGAIFVTLAISLLPWATNIWLLLVVAALHGLGFAAMWPATLNLTADAAREGYQGRALTVVGSAVMPAVGLGVLLFGALAQRTDQWPMLLPVIIQAVSILLVFLVPVKRPRRVNPEEVAKPRYSLKDLTGALVPLLPAALMQTTTMTIVGLWIFKIAPHFNLEYKHIVALLVVGGLIGYGSMPITGRFADRGNARWAVALGYGLVGGALIGFVFTPPVWLLFILTVVAAVGYALLTPGWAALVTQVLPEEERPAAWGVLMTVENIGVLIGPMIGAIFLRMYGSTGPFLISGILALITAAIYLVFRNSFKQHKSETAQEAVS